MACGLVPHLCEGNFAPILARDCKGHADLVMALLDRQECLSNIDQRNDFNSTCLITACMCTLSTPYILFCLSYVSSLSIDTIINGNNHVLHVMVGMMASNPHTILSLSLFLSFFLSLSALQTRFYFSLCLILIRIIVFMAIS